MSGSDSTYRLINSLSRTEKRNLKLLAKLQNGEKRYLHMFKLIDQRRFKDDKELEQVVREETNLKNYSSAKGYLLNTILKSIRFFDTSRTEEIRSLISDIRILMDRRIYREVPKRIRKARQLAEEIEDFYSQLEICDLEVEYLHLSNHVLKEKDQLSLIHQSREKVLESIIIFTKLRTIHEKIVGVRREKGILGKSTDILKLIEEEENQFHKYNSVNYRSWRISTLCSVVELEFCTLKNKFDDSLKISLELIGKLEGKRPFSFKIVPAHTQLKLISYTAALAYESKNDFSLTDFYQKGKQLIKSKKIGREFIFENFDRFFYPIVYQSKEFPGRDEYLKYFEHTLNTFYADFDIKSTAFGFYVLSVNHFIEENIDKAYSYINKFLSLPKTIIPIPLRSYARIFNLVLLLKKGEMELFAYEIGACKKYLSRAGRYNQAEKIILGQLNHSCREGKLPKEYHELLIQQLSIIEDTTKLEEINSYLKLEEWT